MSEEASNVTRAVPYGILMSIGSCWIFGLILTIVIAACMDQNLENLVGNSFGQPMAQIYYDALGKHGAIGMMTLLFIVQFLMGLSILVVGRAIVYSRTLSELSANGYIRHHQRPGKVGLSVETALYHSATSFVK